ncbi:hypothetical protein L207DRAFT_515891 [Hyaloscypha variabilis F]|jgi:predicted esterase|uniref:Serine hydrolase domain-containing protein n=1 Tax=Hyaloscypha variabilis (strain UAMH 11265 / GT02V1 / F) TaxID=1149755 RepID=A0A2J6RCC6_HYAVF|nr:hypothetical protein L207DRAFT_515891 [Hyaloscypha variabilis F]
MSSSSPSGLLSSINAPGKSLPIHFTQTEFANLSLFTKKQPKGTILMANEQDEKDEISLPTMLCLHAYGTNATIFRYQLRHITQALADTFRFVFVEAPFHVQQPGPGVPATFLDAGPYYRWHSDKALAAAFGVSSSDLKEERRQIKQLLRDRLDNERRQAAQGTGMGVVGIIAFSQGAALGAALCLDPELYADIKFAVFFCALYPALSLTEDYDGVATQQVIEIPSIHVQGTSDPWRGQGAKTLGKYFDAARAKKIELKGLRHEVPSKVKDVAMVTSEILKTWKSIRENSEL